MRRTKAFTLIELLVVVAIISLLSSVVIASVSDAREKARSQALVESIKQMMTGLELYNQDHNNIYPGETRPGFVQEGMIFYIMTKSGTGTFQYQDDMTNVGDLKTKLKPYFDISSISNNLKDGEQIIYYWDGYGSACVGQTSTPRFMIIFGEILENDNIPNYSFLGVETEPIYNCLSI